MAITTTITPLQDDLTNYAAQQHLLNAQGNALAGVDASLAASQVGYDNAVADVNQAYDNIARQAYVGYEQGQKALANQLSSTGLYDTGYADTLRVSRANQYASDLNASELERARALRDLAANQEANRLNAEAQKLDISAQFGQALADQANIDRDFLLGQQQYTDSRADVLWEREQYLKEAENAAQQQLISNAYAAAELGDFSQLEALGINTTAAKAAYDQAQRAALLDEAYAAAEVGDFSYLKALGIDTSDLERLWARQLVSSLYGGYGGGSGSGSGSGSSSSSKGGSGSSATTDRLLSDAQIQARKLIINMGQQGKSYDEVVRYVESISGGLRKQFGDDWVDEYTDTVLRGYQEPEEEPEDPATVDDMIAMIEYAIRQNKFDDKDGAIVWANESFTDADYVTAIKAIRAYFD